MSNTGEGRKLFISSDVVKKMREAALAENFKRYAELPLAWRKAIAEEAGLNLLKLSRATPAERRKLQQAAKTIMGRHGMGYVGRAFEILTRTASE
ncbi:MAG: hypothetical protein EPO42_13320 [Gallionellaceae bacterium]|nr:MAG: hypothetical protein EPO42_13320 [Gallionellaceae bacterium]